MSREDTERVKLNVRVPAEKKREYKDAVPEGEPLSSLVRRAIDHEIRDEYVPIDIKTNREPAGSPTDLDPVLDRLDTVERAIHAVEHKFDKATINSSEDVSQSDIEDVSIELLSHIPRFSECVGSESEKIIKQRYTSPHKKSKAAVDAMPEIEEVSVDGTAVTLSEYVDAPTHIVRAALIHLETNTTERIASAIDTQGHRHWINHS